LALEEALIHLVLPFPEALEVATSQKPLPPQIEGLSCQGSTVVVTVNPESVLPKMLRRAVPRIRLELQFESFEAGVARFRLFTNVLSLPVHRLLNLLTQAIPLPRGVSVQKGVGAPAVLVDVQALIDQQLEGLTLEEFYLFGGDLVAVAKLQNFRKK